MDILHVILSTNVETTIRHLHQIDTFEIKPKNIVIHILWKNKTKEDIRNCVFLLLRETKFFSDFTISVSQVQPLKSFIDVFRLTQTLYKSFLIVGDLISFCTDYVLLNSNYFKRLNDIYTKNILNNNSGIVCPVVVNTNQLQKFEEILRVWHLFSLFDEVFVIDSVLFNKIEIPFFVRQSTFIIFITTMLPFIEFYKANNPVSFEMEEKRYGIKELFEHFLFWWHLAILKKGFN